ncbi:MAG: hypothetical protein D6744_04060, partial [Planctomycetota bacterium]
ARAWFKKAADLRERQNYDYAIESYVTGLGFWPDAIEEGILPLWSLAIQRRQAGGKKPSMMETLKRSTSAKDAKQAMLNALYLLSKDPTSTSYADALLKNANKARYHEVVLWAADKVLESLRKDKKASASRFKAFREALVESAARADEAGDPKMAVKLLDRAVQSVELQIGRNPTDMALKDLQRDLAGRLTIAKGKYADGGDFRDSLRDADAQRLLHDAERGKQGAESLEHLIEGTRKAWEEDPRTPLKINAYVDALLKTEQEKYENEAIRVLEKCAQELNNYNFKVRADDVRLRQLARVSRAARDQAKATGSEEDKQQYRLALMDEYQTRKRIFAERVEKYPTDLRLKYKYGEVLFALQEYDEAIPVLQAAQGDPRYRIQCKKLIGQAFERKGDHTQAVDVLREALAAHDRESDDTAKELLYNLGIALEGKGDLEEAATVYGKLLRIDYNYAGGDARRRLEALNAAK